MSPDEQKAVENKLASMIGRPYDKSTGCLGFVLIALGLCGVDIDDLKVEPVGQQPLITAARHFAAVDSAQFGDLVIFEMQQPRDPLVKYHVAFMTGRRWAFQCSISTGGVARVDVTRPEWAPAIRGFYRHEHFGKPPGRGDGRYLCEFFQHEIYRNRKQKEINL